MVSEWMSETLDEDHAHETRTDVNAFDEFISQENILHYYCYYYLMQPFFWSDALHADCT